MHAQTIAKYVKAKKFVRNVIHISFGMNQNVQNATKVAKNVPVQLKDVNHVQNTLLLLIIHANHALETVKNVSQ